MHIKDEVDLIKRLMVAKANRAKNKKKQEGSDEEIEFDDMQYVEESQEGEDETAAAAKPRGRSKGKAKVGRGKRAGKKG